MKLVYLLYACVHQKEEPSMKLIMATTNKETLEHAIIAKIRDGTFGFVGCSGEAAVQEYFKKDVGYIGLDSGRVDVVTDGDWL